MSSIELMTTREVAARLGVTPRQVARLVPEKLPAAYTLPGDRGAHMFDPATVEKYVEGRS